MSDIRQYLITLSDDGVTVRRVELTTPKGMSVQLTEGEYVLAYNHKLSLRLPVLYEGKSRYEALGVIR